MPLTFGLHWLGPRLSPFLKAHPDLMIHQSTRDQQVDFGREKFDAAVHFGALEQMCIDAAQLLSCAQGLLDWLVVHPEAMRTNIDRTQGAIYTESVTVALADRLGRRSAHELMREIVARMVAEGLTLAEALAGDPRCDGVILPDADSAMGEAPALVDACLERLGYRA